MATPFLQPLKIQGGTFYTFASAAKDISKTFTDDNARFVFSKYALLDLPIVSHPTNQGNTIVWQALDSFGGNSLPSSNIADDFLLDNNYNFAQAFQSYALNFEQLILAGLNNLNIPYDETVLSTVSERVWWHFLKNINAIRWDDASTAQSNVPLRYREEDLLNNPTEYKTVVKYLGEIEVINQVSRGGQSYSEIYIHVPTSHGSTPLVLFKTEQDQNYLPNESWRGIDDIIYKRSNGFGPFGLNNDAFYDDPGNDDYVLGATFGNTYNVGSTAYINTSPYQVLISSMDGVQIDFNPDNYTDITSDNSLQTIDDYNVALGQDFEFNCCLVYYDTYDVSNPQNYARNLYGILVIDDYVNGPQYSYLKNFSKYKPNPVTKLNGNSYGLKLNLKFDTSTDTVGVETVIREDLTFGMDLFADASVRLQESADMFIDQKLEVIDMNNRLSSLEQYYFSQITFDELTSRVNELQSNLNNAKLNFSDETTLLDLIKLNSKDINDIVTGQISVNLTYNTDVIQPGSGIIIDDSVPNQISVINKVQNYYTFLQSQNNAGYLSYGINNGFYPGASANGNRLILGEFSNYYRNVGATIPTFLDNLIINLDDSNVKWKQGQTLRLVFGNDIDISTYQINIKTDAQNIKGSGDYGVLVGSLNISDLVTTKPIIEIICKDAAAYTFYVDVIK